MKHRYVYATLSLATVILSNAALEARCRSGNCGRRTAPRAAAPVAAPVVQKAVALQHSITPTNYHEASSISDINNTIKNNENVIVRLYRPTCKPCNDMEPLVKKVASEMTTTVTVINANMDNNTFDQLWEMYDVQTVPTFLYFIDGKFVGKHKSIKTEEGLRTTVATLFHC